MTFSQQFKGRPSDRRSNGNTSETDPSSRNQTPFGFNFEFPRINISNIVSQTLNSSRNAFPSNLANFMSPTRSGTTTTSSNSNTNSNTTGGTTTTTTTMGGCHPTATPSKDVMCEECGAKLNFYRRKKKCSDCFMDYCYSCFVKGSYADNCPESVRRNKCKRCRVFMRQPLDKVELMTLRVRDLRWYLQKNRVSSRFCKEKSELVDLVLQLNGGSGFQTSMGSRSSSTNFAPAQPSTSTTQSSDNDTEWVLLPEDVATNDEPSPSSSHITTPSTVQEPTEMEAPVELPSASMHEDTSNSSADVDFKPFNIDDVTSAGQINDLSVRQLKLLLTRNFVDYKGCCEKDELQEKALRLYTERKKKLAPEEITDENICKICMNDEIDCVLLECGHVVTCTNCGKHLSECPICRQYVIRAVRIFRS